MSRFRLMEKQVKERQCEHAKKIIELQQSLHDVQDQVRVGSLIVKEVIQGLMYSFLS